MSNPLQRLSQAIWVMHLIHVSSLSWILVLSSLFLHLPWALLDYFESFAEIKVNFSHVLDPSCSLGLDNFHPRAFQSKVYYVVCECRILWCVRFFSGFLLIYLRFPVCSFFHRFIVFIILLVVVLSLIFWLRYLNISLISVMCSFLSAGNQGWSDYCSFCISWSYRR